VDNLEADSGGGEKRLDVHWRICGCGVQWNGGGVVGERDGGAHGAKLSRGCDRKPSLFADGQNAWCCVCGPGTTPNAGQTDLNGHHEQRGPGRAGTGRLPWPGRWPPAVPEIVYARKVDLRRENAVRVPGSSRIPLRYLLFITGRGNPVGESEPDPAARRVTGPAGVASGRRGGPGDLSREVTTSYTRLAV
jgi:hypothetical protein